MRRITGVLAAAVLAVAVAACAGASAADPTGSSTAVTATGAPDGASGVQVDAKDIAFTQTSITASADHPFQIAFSNQDSAPHNITIIGPDGSTAFTGDVVSGPGSTTYSVPALKAGTYQFRCDIHPNMTGTLVVR